MKKQNAKKSDHSSRSAPVFATQHSKRRGITLVEMVIYIAIFGVLTVMISGFLVEIVNTYHLLRAEREVSANARLVLETVTKAVAQAEGVYAPTSRFDSDAGQLSLISPAAAFLEHPSGYIDFWTESDGRLWMRQEGGEALPLSASSVRVSRFRITRLVQTLNRQAIKLTLRVDALQAKIPTSTTLNATVVMRGNY